MSDQYEIRFDTFVVKLWQLAEVGAVIRVEVEHVQSAGHSKAVWREQQGEEATDVSMWIADQLLRPREGGG